MASRKGFTQEMSAVLGSYSPEDGIIVAGPASLGDIPEEFVLAHEGVHRLLTWGTLFGFFERIVFAACRQARRTGNMRLWKVLRAVMVGALDASLSTHEGVASYVELCVCAQNHDHVEDHCQSFAPEYAKALSPIVDLLGIPSPSSPLQPYQWSMAVLLAKVALNGPILRVFADPSGLTSDAFARFQEVHSPDLRFAHLCRAVRERGGLDFLLPQWSQIWAAVWHSVLASHPQFCDAAAHGQIVDLLGIGGLMYMDGNRICDATEHQLMRLLASCAAGLDVTIGPEEMEMSATPFLRYWRPLLPADAQQHIPADGHTEITPPSDPRQFSRSRTYRVRFRLKNVTRRVSLDELRAFLGDYSARGFDCVTGFLETTDMNVAVFAASIAGFDRLSAEPANKIRVQEAVIGVMPISEILDFAVLHLSEEVYAERTAWHLPLEIAHRYGFPNLAVGLHGALLRSWPLSDPSAVAGVVKAVANKGERVFIRTVDLTPSKGDKVIFNLDTCQATIVDERSKAIVIQALCENLPRFERLPCSPDFTAWLGNQGDIGHILDGIGHRDNVEWGHPPQDANEGLLRSLLDVAYNLDHSCLGGIFEGNLVPVDNPMDSE
jgi:hypothetical protein